MSIISRTYPSLCKFRDSIRFDTIRFAAAFHMPRAPGLLAMSCTGNRTAERTGSPLTSPRIIGEGPVIDFSGLERRCAGKFAGKWKLLACSSFYEYKIVVTPGPDRFLELPRRWDLREITRLVFVRDKNFTGLNYPLTCTLRFPYFP